MPKIIHTKQPSNQHIIYGDNPHARYSVRNIGTTLHLAFFSVFSAGFLGLLALAVAVSVSPASASPLDVSVTIPPSLNVTLTGTDASGNVSLNLNPATSAFSTRDLTISVGTNNPSGYTLTMTANGTSLIRTEAVSGTYPTIATLASEVAEGSFTTNRWGYRFTDNTTNTNFQPLPGVDPATGITTLPISESDSAVNNKARTITFGAKVDTTQTPGDYELAMTFAAVAKPNITYIQDLPDAQCTTTPTEVVDSRDGKLYTIARLADGKCWMTSNLDLAGGTTITSADSDVSSDYTLPPSAIKNSSDNNLTDSTQFSDNATAYVFNSGNTSDCGGSGQNTPCGSYYSWLAATAGTGSSTANYHNAPSSICPKGWRLPTATTSNANATSGTNYQSGDFYQMAIHYGLASGVLVEDPDNDPKFIDYAGPGTVPNFLLAGRYNSGLFYYGGNGGSYWSATASGSPLAYSMGFNSGGVGSVYNDSRKLGFSVRCVRSSQ